MKKLRIELVVAVFIFISCISSGAAFANQSSVSLEAPNSVERGTEITIKVHVKRIDCRVQLPFIQLFVTKPPENGAYEFQPSQL